MSVSTTEWRRIWAVYRGAPGARRRVGRPRAVASRADGARATGPSRVGGAVAVQGDAHGSAPVGRAERDVSDARRGRRRADDPHALAAITGTAWRRRRRPLLSSRAPAPSARCARLESDRVWLGSDSPREEVRRMYRWEVPKLLARRLATIRDRTGVPVARQLRRAVDEYLDQHESPAALRAAGAIPNHHHTRRQPAMTSINRVVLLGHLTRTPKLSYTPAGTTVCDFGLALHRRWLDINGDAQQETTCVEVTALEPAGGGDQRVLRAGPAARGRGPARGGARGRARPARGARG